MASRGMRLAIVALAVAAGAFGLAAALVVPAGLPYDEPAHWSNVLYYAENLGPPVLGEPGVTYQGQQAPLSYAIAAVVVRLAGDADAAFLAVRLLGVAGAVALTLLIGGILVRSIPNRPAVIILGTAFIALNPMFAVIAGSVQNDTWTLVWAFALLWAALPFMDASRTSPRPWAWGLLFGALGSAAILTKLSIAPLVVAVLAVLLLRRRVVMALTAGGVVLAACGWWIVRNYLLYGDLTGQAGVERAGYEFGQGALGPLHLARSALTYLFLPTEYLRNSIVAPWWIDGIVVVLGLAVAIGAVLLAVRVRRRLHPGFPAPARHRGRRRRRRLAPSGDVRLARRLPHRVRSAAARGIGVRLRHAGGPVAARGYLHRHDARDAAARGRGLGLGHRVRRTRPPHALTDLRYWIDDREDR